jgi:hypothetical protein
MYSNFPLKNTNTGSITVKTFLTRFIKWKEGTNNQ